MILKTVADPGALSNQFWQRPVIADEILRAVAESPHSPNDVVFRQQGRVRVRRDQVVSTRDRTQISVVIEFAGPTLHFPQPDEFASRADRSVPD